MNGIPTSHNSIPTSHNSIPTSHNNQITNKTQTNSHNQLAYNTYDSAYISQSQQRNDNHNNQITQNVKNHLKFYILYFKKMKIINLSLIMDMRVPTWIFQQIFLFKQQTTQHVVAKFIKWVICQIIASQTMLNQINKIQDK